MRRVLLGLLAALALATGARAQQNVVTPSTLSGFNGMPLKVGSLNGWGLGLVAQDQWTATPASGGTGNAVGDVLTLNDGCATHAKLAVVAVTSGAVTQALTTVRGSCAVAPVNPVSVLSTTGVGAGATFNVAWEPEASSLYVAPSANGNLFLTDTTSPQAGLYGGENVFIAHGAGGAATGNSSFNTFLGLNDFGIGGGSPTVISSSTGVGTDCARDITTSGGTITGIDCFGAGALSKLGSVSISGSFSSIGAFGNHSFANLTAVGGNGSLAVGPNAGYGASSGLTVGNSTVIGPAVAQNATYMNNVLILGTAIAQTALNDQDVILIGTGATAVEPPTTTTNDYLNFNNIWTATSINVPASSVSTFAGTLTAPSVKAGTSGFGLGTTVAMNLLSNVSSPILSPETANIPTATGVYTGAPLISGWTDTSTATGGGIYSQMATDNVTLLASGTNHYGMEERTLQTVNNVTYSGELNVTKFLLRLDGGTLYGGEAVESSVDNFAHTSEAAAYTTDLYNEAGATVTGYMVGLNIGWTNANTTAGSVANFIGINCIPMIGGGAVPYYSACLQNFDPTQRIVTMGHLALRSNGTTNPSVTACGTSCPTQLTTNSDMSGVVTEGTSATGFTLTFLINDNYVCSLSPLNGAAATDMASSSWSAPQPSYASPWVVAHPSSNGASFRYLCTTTG
jgi:hypothetical protein